MPRSTLEREHIVDFAEEALLQVNIDPENSFVKPLFDELCTLVTTTEKNQWNESRYNRAEQLITSLIIYRDINITYFDPK